jgi:hypothetical protein
MLLKSEAFIKGGVLHGGHLSADGSVLKGKD